VILADDLIDAKVPVTKQMVDIAMRENVSTIGVMEVPAADIGSWGIVETAGAEVKDGVSRITRIVEKPKPGSTPSTWRWSAAMSSRPRSSITCARSRRARAARSSSPTASRG
jgi:UTP-glucose-1-phosphate uridylyltransferase